MAALPTNIDGVIEALDGIIAAARRDRSRLGYFAALYRKVTVSVQAGIGSGRFENGPRMEKLDVVFANRYLAALGRWNNGDPPTRSWKVAFRAAESSQPVVLQHLLLGMNAHINLDLGIAAARVAPGAAIADLRADFDEINRLLAEHVDEVKADLTRVWPRLALLDRLSGPADDEIVNFSIAAARQRAWLMATKLAPLAAQDQSSRIARADTEVAALGRLIRRPGFAASAVTTLVRLTERDTVPQIIDLLA